MNKIKLIKFAIMNDDNYIDVAKYINIISYSDETSVYLQLDNYGELGTVVGIDKDIVIYEN